MNSFLTEYKKKCERATLMHNKYYLNRIRDLQQGVVDHSYHISIEHFKNLPDLIRSQQSMIRRSARQVHQFYMDMDLKTLRPMALTSDTYYQYKQQLQPYIRSNRGHVNIKKCLSGLLQMYNSSAIIERFHKRLRREEKERQHEVRVCQVQRGVYKKIAPPVYPINDDEQKQLEEAHVFRGVSKQFVTEYVTYLRQSLASTPSSGIVIMRPILQEIITMMLLFQCRNSNPFRSYTLPRLMYIDRIESRDFDSFALVTPQIWGTTTKPHAIFASCTFMIDGILYTDIWIEYPLLQRTITYRDIASSALWSLVGNTWRKAINRVHTIEDIYLIPCTVDYDKAGLRRVLAQSVRHMKKKKK